MRRSPGPLRWLPPILLLGLLTLAPPVLPVAPSATPTPAAQKNEEIVTFNTKTLKFHCRSCRWAKRCTVNCVDVPRSEAIRRGGVPCKVCGGSCRR